MRKIITIHGTAYRLYWKNEDKTTGIRQPHMVNVATGEIPFGEQRPLLRDYLLSQNVDLEPWCKKNTHWCIWTAMNLD